MDAKKRIQKQVCNAMWLLPVGGALFVLGIPLVTVGIGALMLAVGFFMLIIGLLGPLPALIRMNANLKRLEELGLLEKAAEELDSPSATVVGKGKGVLTENFLFGKNTGLVLPYTDILWTYKHKQTTTVLFIPVQTVESLMICTAKKQAIQAINLGGKDKKEELKNAILTIYQKNPNVLVGYSQENQKAYKALRKAR